mmetsp:Transcript_51943/g.149762  ORF Transcript_51943/g.149762 Transcript_51943/m.149762 type:complete len:347 (-) Transcript_51943:458-1498(-)
MSLNLGEQLTRELQQGLGVRRRDPTLLHLVLQDVLAPADADLENQRMLAVEKPPRIQLLREPQVTLRCGDHLLHAESHRGEALQLGELVQHSLVRLDKGVQALHLGVCPPVPERPDLLVEPPCPRVLVPPGGARALLLDRQVLDDDRRERVLSWGAGLHRAKAFLPLRGPGALCNRRIHSLLQLSGLLDVFVVRDLRCVLVPVRTIQCVASCLQEPTERHIADDTALVKLAIQEGHGVEERDEDLVQALLLIDDIRLERELHLRSHDLVQMLAEVSVAPPETAHERVPLLSHSLVPDRARHKGAELDDGIQLLRREFAQGEQAHELRVQKAVAPVDGEGDSPRLTL